MEPIVGVILGIATLVLAKTTYELFKEFAWFHKAEETSIKVKLADGSTKIVTVKLKERMSEEHIQKVAATLGQAVDAKISSKD